MMTANSNSISSTQFKSKKPLRLVLDEPVLFVEDKPAMVRGEVIVHFSHDTTIQGPIDLAFESIQTFYPWSEIMVNRAIGGPIESKLQVIELSLLPPNSQGIMPAGVHRFPFEFPIPPTLPPTLNITNRIAIYHRLTATLQKSNEGSTFADWARRSIGKKKLSDVSHLRLVRAIEATPPRPMTPPPSSSSASSTSATSLSSNNEAEVIAPYHDLWTQYNNRLSLDEQHDQLVHSMGGRTTDNYAQPLHALTKEHGMRYKLSVDRTAIALGTTVGLEVVLQPTQVRTKVRSIFLNIEEKRTYKMNIPGRHSALSSSPAETRKRSESNKTTLKWAYGYPIPPEDGSGMRFSDFTASGGNGAVGSTDSKKHITHLGQQYSHDISDCKVLRQLDQPFNGQQQQQQQQQQEYQKNASINSQPAALQKHGSSTSIFSAIKPSSSRATSILEKRIDINSTTSSLPLSSANGGLMDLKLLDHAIELGEYFEGRFVLPTPPCNGMLHPSMYHDNIKIQHWLRLVVVLEQDGHMFEICLESPMHMLDCRLVADDERQTILPPPPSYNLDDDDRSIRTSVFWEQRQPITTSAQWGTCRRPCPCQVGHYRAQRRKQKALSSSGNHHPGGGGDVGVPPSGSGNDHGGNRTNATTSTAAANRDPSHLQDHPVAGIQPEWGPPPLYTD